MTRLGIIVVMGLNRRSKGALAWKWLRGLAANAALAAPPKKTHTAEVHSHTTCTDIRQSVCVFSLRHIKRLLKTRENSISSLSGPTLCPRSHTRLLIVCLPWLSQD